MTWLLDIDRRRITFQHHVATASCLAPRASDSIIGSWGANSIILCLLGHEVKEIQNETLVNSFMLCSRSIFLPLLLIKCRWCLLFLYWQEIAVLTFVLFSISFVPFCDDDHAGRDHHALLTKLFVTNSLEIVTAEFLHTTSFTPLYTYKLTRYQAWRGPT